MVFKIRVILDAKENVFRDIEIMAKQSLWSLHIEIINAFSLDEGELSTFTLLDDKGTVIKNIPLEDMSDEGHGEIMSGVCIDKAFKHAGDKAQFQYGLLDLWEFFCERIEAKEETTEPEYPITVYRFGNVPSTAPVKSINVGENKRKSEASVLEENFDFYDNLEVEENYLDEDIDFYEDDEK